MSRSVARAFFAALTVFVYASVAFSVCWVIATPSTHDGMKSPSELARAPYTSKEQPYVWVAGDVVGCHSANDGTVLVYAVTDDVGHAPDIVFVRYPADGRPQHNVGESVAFAGFRLGWAVVEATADLSRPPL